MMRRVFGVFEAFGVRKERLRRRCRRDSTMMQQLMSQVAPYVEVVPDAT
jgi:hypothetical protein